MYYPEGMKARVSPVQSIEPHRILAPSRDLNREPLGPQSRGYMVRRKKHHLDPRAGEIQSVMEDSQSLQGTAPDIITHWNCSRHSIVCLQQTT